MLVNIPNSLTLARIVLVPLVGWLIITHEMTAAFLLFLAAGMADAAGGFGPQGYGWRRDLGPYVGPMADKAPGLRLYVPRRVAADLPVRVAVAVLSRGAP